MRAKLKYGNRDCGSKTRVYQSWNKIKSRCLNNNNSRFPHYGGRGITVCDRWMQSINNFIDDMGFPPTDKHQIDRIDNDGNYEPGNCRWATCKENNQNKSDSKRWVVDGVTHLSIRDAAKTLNVGVTTIGRWCKGYTARGKYYPPKANCYSYNIYQRSVHTSHTHNYSCDARKPGGAA